MRRALPLLLACLLTPSLLPSTGCGAARKELREERSEERQRQREVTRLGEITEAYWRYLRWDDPGMAATHIEDGDRRMAWLTQGGGSSSTRYRSADVIRVEVGPLLEEDQAPRLREAVVVVRVQVYRVDEQVLRDETFSQQWYRVPAGWFVEAGQELGEDR